MIGNLRPFLPFALFMAFVGWAMVMALISALFQDSLPERSNQLVAAIGAAGIVIIFALFLAITTCRDFAQCKLELTDDRLIVRAPTSRGIEERRFSIDTIEEFVLGRYATALEQLEKNTFWLSPVLALTSAARDAARSGALSVRTSEETAVFHSIDKLFARSSINAIVNELAARGVKIRRISTDFD